MDSHRPPIVVILGHVDHGKTTLLDYLRQTDVAAREAGGITQHIRSFQLRSASLPGFNSPITFIDTPGHEAFSALRARGSQIADLAVLVIAGDDSIKPQTRQSLEFIRQSQLPFIVAINKSDLPTTDAQRVKNQLAQEGVVVEELGGDVPVVSISAKTGSGIPDLLEIIYLLSSLQPSSADPQAPLEAVVLEGRLDSKKGPLAVVVVKNGTLSLAQKLYQSDPVGKVKLLTNPDGQTVASAVPSSPVEILGLTSVPAAGSVISDQPFPSSPRPPSSASPIPPSPGSPTQLNLIVKADFAGSLEAILASLPPTVSVISSGTGDVVDNDIFQAATSQASIITFNSRVPNSVAKLAELEKVPIYRYKIIYELLDQIHQLLNPSPTSTPLGKAEIVAEFQFDSDRVAGCRCLEGGITRSDSIRIERAGQEIGQSRIKSLRTGKTATQSVKSGSEFGAIFSPAVDFRVGDIIISHRNG